GNCIGQIVQAYTWLEAMLGHSNVFASKAKRTFTPRDFGAGSAAVAFHKDVIEIGEIGDRLAVLGVLALEHLSLGERNTEVCMANRFRKKIHIAKRLYGYPRRVSPSR